MISGDYLLELCNVFHSGQVEPTSCMQRLLGTTKTGVILKDVSLTVQSGEVLAVLGSKGSGKKALLDVISRRVEGPTRGQILLNNQPMSLTLFQQRCGYVNHKCDFIEGLSIEQTLYFTPTKLSGYLKKSKVKQIMADLALSQIANRCVENLTKSERRRLMIGVQLIKDPVILLLDEPTWNLDPLNTYLVISILSNAAKKYGTAIILTMEKPRSDVFPFLDKVLYLCLGDAVYTGKTRQMLEYFTAIGFPCPQLENPLMYYLCLSTVDRRSRERFVESNNQISALVDKFKMEIAPLRKTPSMGHLFDGSILSHGNKVPLFQSQPSGFYVGWMLYLRLLTATFTFNLMGLKQLFFRLLLMPLYFFALWIFYRNVQDDQHSIASKTGLLFNCIVGTYFLAILNAVILFPAFRTRYYQESQEGTYGGALFLLTYNLVSIPFALIAMFGSSAIVFTLLNSIVDEPENYIYFSLTLFACYVLAEQTAIAILMCVKDRIKAGISSLYITAICVVLGSGLLRSFKGLQEWLFYLTYAIQIRYAALFLNRLILLGPMSESLLYENKSNCNTSILMPNNNNVIPQYCLYNNGFSFLSERYSRENNEPIFAGIFDDDINLYMTMAFSLGIVLFNLMLYMMPLPTYIKSKFR